MKSLFKTKYRIVELSTGEFAIQFKAWYTFFIWDKLCNCETIDSAEEFLLRLKKRQAEKVIKIYNS